MKQRWKMEVVQSMMSQQLWTLQKRSPSTSRTQWTGSYWRAWPHSAARSQWWPGRGSGSWWGSGAAWSGQWKWSQPGCPAWSLLWQRSWQHTRAQAAHSPDLRFLEEHELFTRQAELDFWRVPTVQWIHCLCLVGTIWVFCRNTVFLSFLWKKEEKQ